MYLQTIWIHAGVSTSARDIPLYFLATHYGEHVCSTLPALHHLFGADYTSKVATKMSALKGDPKKYLLDFADIIK